MVAAGKTETFIYFRSTDDTRYNTRQLVSHALSDTVGRDGYQYKTDEEWPLF